jgi:hypothetical protein
LSNLFHASSEGFMKEDWVLDLGGCLFPPFHF